MEQWAYIKLVSVATILDMLVILASQILMQQNCANTRCAGTNRIVEQRRLVQTRQSLPFSHT